MSTPGGQAGEESGVKGSGRRGFLADSFRDSPDGFARPTSDLRDVDDLPFTGVNGTGDLMIEVPSSLFKALLGCLVCPNLCHQVSRRHTHIVARHCHASQLAIFNAK